ncbi:MAG: glucosaminidase domain-containing protein [Saprospiraceae bacterium]|nr:glucosaminidase domain-containing protein [Saprospiraceae bacterium]
MAQLQYAQSQRPGARMAQQTSADTVLPEAILWKLLLLTALAYLVWSEKFTIVFDFGGGALNLHAPEQTAAEAGFSSDFSVEHPKNSPVKKTSLELPRTAKNNLSYAIDPGFAARYDVEPAEVRRSLSTCQEYIKRFAPVAQTEMQRSGIPASIILAQALLESDAGQSKLAKQTNNHFGMKCFSKNCRKGHCANFTDDSHKDFFVQYGNAWASYRDHSKFLKSGKRYQKLFKYDATDYKSWARGLAKAGYATDKQYGEKLIAMIQSLGLDKYDVVADAQEEVMLP